MNVFENMKILVIGDSCTDIFIYGDANRLAPEGPVPVLVPSRTTQNGGMALNVVNNIKAMGFNCDLITHDEKILKTRFVDERTNYLLLRIDENDRASKIDKNILKNINNNYYNGVKYDALIISDYCKGFLSEMDIQTISKNNYNVFMDTKKILGPWCEFVNFIKINNTEFDKTKHTLKNLNLKGKLIITRSEKGCEYDGTIFPVKKVNIKDLSGAGDTFIAGLVCEFLKTNDIVKAIQYAQECAAKVVSKKGVCTI